MQAHITTYLSGGAKDCNS